MVMQRAAGFLVGGCNPGRAKIMAAPPMTAVLQLRGRLICKTIILPNKTISQWFS